MPFLKRAALLIGIISVVFMLAACGGTTPTSSNSSSSNQSANSSSDNKPAANGYGSSSKSTTPTTAATTAGPVVKTTTLNVQGKSMTVLTNAQGMTLYYYVPDTSKSVACTGGCAQAWPPLLFSGSGSVTAGVKLPGALEAYKNANGNQIVYNDHPLYTYSGDTAAGQANGQGAGGNWFVVTPTLAKNK